MLGVPTSICGDMGCNNCPIGNLAADSQIPFPQAAYISRGRTKQRRPYFFAVLALMLTRSDCLRSPANRSFQVVLKVGGGKNSVKVRYGTFRTEVGGKILMIYF